MAGCFGCQTANQLFQDEEAERLDGEFDRHLGWTAPIRDEKLSILIPIIKKHARLRVAVSIDKAAFAQHLRTIPFPNRTSIVDKPYFLAFHYMVMGLAAQYLIHGSYEKCDFIFDEQGSIGNDVLALWDGIKTLVKQMAEDGRTDFRPVLGSKPFFRDDKEFKPLQAADLYAWQVRRLFYENKVLTAPQRAELRMIAQLPAMTWHLGLDQIRQIRLGLLRSSATFSKDNPNAKLVEYQGSKKAQKRARVVKRASASKAKP